jgi:hypothetical protein
MKRKLSALAILAALVALALPASSMAAAKMYPAGSSFEIPGAMKLTTSIGTCTLQRISGQIPAAPKNETTGSIAVPAPTVGSCSPGITLTTSGTWQATTDASHLALHPPQAIGMELKLNSNQLCIAVPTAGDTLSADWQNGTTSPFVASGYHANGGFNLQWEGPGCTYKAGTLEPVTYTDQAVGPGGTIINFYRQVLNLTNSRIPITVG